MVPDGLFIGLAAGTGSLINFTPVSQTLRHDASICKVSVVPSEHPLGIPAGISVGLSENGLREEATASLCRASRPTPAPALLKFRPP
ncbi:hypothetical protein MPL3356_120048 [Mesorhizobium plurifarium]|uniref:Uncharacterized protein n=1 Tax=Mesorhizobium plurifarium TaxID=69974 RepID=A0A090DH41_MESPL|nr:hypothetical protein MPL3356_120048 [Mesorhizobium plurifarium]